MVFVDCSTEDLKRLDEQTVALAGEIQQVQMNHTDALEPRDKLIVLQVSILALERAAASLIKAHTTPRFHRSIGMAYRLMRSFRVKPDAK